MFFLLCISDPGLSAIPQPQQMFHLTICDASDGLVGPMPLCLR